MSFNFTTEYYDMIKSYKEHSGEKTLSGALHLMFSDKKGFAWMTKNCKKYPCPEGKPTYQFVGDHLSKDVNVNKAIKDLCVKYHHDFLGIVRLVMKESDVQKEYKRLMNL